MFCSTVLVFFFNVSNYVYIGSLLTVFTRIFWLILSTSLFLFSLSALLISMLHDPYLLFILLVDFPSFLKVVVCFSLVPFLDFIRSSFTYTCYLAISSAFLNLCFQASLSHLIHVRIMEYNFSPAAGWGKGLLFFFFLLFFFRVPL